MRQRANNFDFLRLLAAVLVVFEHSYSLLGEHTMFRHVTGIGLGGIATDIFFIISGFLIASSWQNSPDPRGFSEKRVLRIFPALLFSTLCTIFLIGCIATSLPINDYFTRSETYLFLMNVLMSGIYSELPGVFEDAPYTAIVNGSLWTLRVEIMLYLVVMMAGLLHYKRAIFVLLLLITLIAFFGWGVPEKLAGGETLYLWGVSLYHLTLKCSFFFIGALVYWQFGQLKFHSTYFIVALALTGVVTVSGDITLVKAVLFVTLPYLLLSFAQCQSAFCRSYLSKFGKYGDFSYGIYVFAFPIQQLMIDVFSLSRPLFVFLTSFPLILLMAFVSWHLVEKRALALKPRR